MKPTQKQTCSYIKTVHEVENEALEGILSYWIEQEEFALNALHYATAQKNMFMSMYAERHPELFNERILSVVHDD
jgi:hypothetical protein